MSGRYLIITIVAVIVAAGVYFLLIDKESEVDKDINQSNQGVMKLTSPPFGENGLIESKFTCDGENINPALNIEGISEEAKSLVLIMDDPDAIKPTGKVWDHWIVFNIDPSTQQIEEGVEPQGVHGIGTGGNSDYSGPCPPDAEHTYIFKLYALDAMLDIPEGSTKPQVEAAMEGHILEETQLTGRYNRS